MAHSVTKYEAGDHTAEYSKGDEYNISRKVKGIVKSVRFDHKHWRTEVRIVHKH
jgi:hypothetical protein